MSDPVDRPLLPSGISDLPVSLNGRFVYIFEDADGTDALHFLGDFELTVGDHEGQQLGSREAVIWMADQELDGRTYHRLQILLWGDARIEEIGGTTTTGPALFVTLNAFSDITLSADDIAMQSSESLVYREGNRIRKAVAAGTHRAPDEEVSLRVLDAAGFAAPRKTPTPRPVIHFQSHGEILLTRADERQQVLAVTGGVYLSRGVPGTGDFL